MAVELSGCPGGWAKLRSHWRGLVGAYDELPLPSATRWRLWRASHWKAGGGPTPAAPAALAAGRQNGLLRLAAGCCAGTWGNPCLRFVLLAEHGGCSTSTDGLRKHSPPPTPWRVRLADVEHALPQRTTICSPRSAFPCPAAATPLDAADSGAPTISGLPGGATERSLAIRHTGAANG